MNRFFCGSSFHVSGLRAVRGGVTALVIAGGLLGCASNGASSDGGWNNKAKGAAIGAAVGVVTGLITGDDATERRQHAMIGAGIGALAGTAVGAYMDAQQNKLNKELAGTGVAVERDGDELLLRMPSNITFDTNSAAVKSEFHSVLDSVANVLTEYDKTYIDIAGHTDSRGSEAYNQTLSEQRAMSVGQRLIDNGVQNVRVVAQGLGESAPVADNASAAGACAEPARRSEAGPDHAVLVASTFPRTAIPPQSLWQAS